MSTQTSDSVEITRVDEEVRGWHKTEWTITIPNEPFDDEYTVRSEVGPDKFSISIKSEFGTSTKIVDERAIREIHQILGELLAASTDTKSGPIERL